MDGRSEPPLRRAHHHSGGTAGKTHRSTANCFLFVLLAAVEIISEFRSIFSLGRCAPGVWSSDAKCLPVSDAADTAIESPLNLILALLGGAASAGSVSRASRTWQEGFLGKQLRDQVRGGPPPSAQLLPFSAFRAGGAAFFSQHQPCARPLSARDAPECLEFCPTRRLPAARLLFAFARPDRARRCDPVARLAPLHHRQ